VSVPLVAVTVTVEVPAGVPGSLLPPPPLPPPQLANVMRQVTAMRESKRLQTRRFDPLPNRKIPARVAPRPAVHPAGPSNLALWAAVVEIVSVVEPLLVTEAGLKLHVLSCGNPAHDAAEKLMVPPYPGWPVTVSMTVPLPPGLAIVIDGVAAARAKSACTFTVVAEEIDPV